MSNGNIKYRSLIRKKGRGGGRGGGSNIHVAQKMTAMIKMITIPAIENKMK